MIKVTYPEGCRLGNHLYLYVAGRLIAERLGLAFQANPIEGFPRTRDVVVGESILGPETVLEGADPIPSWPDVEHLRGKSLRIKSGFVHSRYFVADRDKIRDWCSTDFKVAEADPDDILVNVRLGDFLPRRATQDGLVMDPSYYTTILDGLKFKTLYLMTDEKSRHPYLNYFWKYRPQYVNGWGVKHFARGASFKRIVMSNSTFCWWFTFASKAKEIYFPMINGARCGSWSIGQLPAIDLRWDWPEVTTVYNVRNWGPNPDSPPSLVQAAEAQAFAKNSKNLFLGETPVNVIDA